MSERKDLTRWNRAGLSRFRYVDAKAAEYLEILRQQLVERFADPETELCEWLVPGEKVPANEEEAEDETPIQRQERLSRKQERVLEMYHQDRRDLAWEITRTFARACHILTEHSNAYANEGYLGTATQWDHVRRLVEMLDYHPAPPASASTWLILLAKENQSGTVEKGFQVKYRPAAGSAKVVFETLEDLLIDSELNALRPKGWDQAQEPVLPSDGTPPPNEERQFSTIAKGPAINIQGVGQVSAAKLDTLASDGSYKIKDFLSLDTDGSALDIAATSLREWKAKADIICNFVPEGEWVALAEWLLPSIAEASEETLEALSGNSEQMAKNLKREIAKIEICLDQPIYCETRFKDLLEPEAIVTGTVETSWIAERKPKVVPDDVVMIYREYKDESTGQDIDEAEAATVASVDKTTKAINLTPSPGQTSWFKWKKSEAKLKISPRWKRECWLNGPDVIRTKKPHGLTAGTFVGWDIKRKSTGRWNYSKIEYAEIIEVDKRNIRVKYNGILPEEDTDLIELRPIDGTQVSADYEEVVLLGDQDEGDIKGVLEDVAPQINASPTTDSIFTIKELTPPDSSGGGGLLPPASLPKIGSFLFPTPMLPIDLVKAAVELMLNLGLMQIPSTKEFVIKGLPFGDLLGGVDNLSLAASNLFNLLDALYMKDEDDVVTKMVDWVDTDAAQSITKLEQLLGGQGGSATALFQEIKEEIERKGPLLAVPKNPPIKAIADSVVPRFVVEGTPDEIASGDWVVGGFTHGVRALKVNAISVMTDSDGAKRFSVGFEEEISSDLILEKLYADFRGELTAEESTVNTTPVDPEEIELEEVPENLKVGRDVLLMSEDSEPVAAKIEKIDGNTIKTKPKAEGYTKGDLVICGNVVLAGHGERKPEIILGSGNAAKSNQEFTLEVEQVSFTKDATMSSGVAAAIEVEVAGRVWEQVATLKDSTPVDHHYVTRMTEEGYVKIVFGDGQYGRRLPTGKNNIRVSYRVGSGLEGNVPARGLEKPVKPHAVVKEVIQPLRASGGGDMEETFSLRENAPSSLLALERAVSLSDFSHLAASQSSVWQAKAHSQVNDGGRTERVNVVIVAADGVQSSEVRDAVKSYLMKHALPGVQVTVNDFKPKHFDLSVTVRVDTNEFNADEVEKAVKTALKDKFALKNRKLGAHLYLSEVYKVVEGIEGVENSTCVLDDDSTLLLIKADNESTVVYLDTTDEESTFTVTAEEYRP